MGPVEDEELEWRSAGRCFAPTDRSDTIQVLNDRAIGPSIRSVTAWIPGRTDRPDPGSSDVGPGARPTDPVSQP